MSCLLSALVAVFCLIVWKWDVSEVVQLEIGKLDSMASFGTLWLPGSWDQLVWWPAVAWVDTEWSLELYQESRTHLGWLLLVSTCTSWPFLHVAGNWAVRLPALRDGKRPCGIVLPDGDPAAGYATLPAPPLCSSASAKFPGIADQR
jgi:hypothetical protein